MSAGWPRRFSGTCSTSLARCSLSQTLSHIGIDKARGDAVHGDVAAADLLRERFGEAYHARL